MPELQESWVDDPDELALRDSRDTLRALASAGAQVRESITLSQEAGIGGGGGGPPPRAGGVAGGGGTRRGGWAPPCLRQLEHFVFEKGKMRGGDTAPPGPK